MENELLPFSHNWSLLCLDLPWLPSHFSSMDEYALFQFEARSRGEMRCCWQPLSSQGSVGAWLRVQCGKGDGLDHLYFFAWVIINSDAMIRYNSLLWSSNWRLKLTVDNPTLNVAWSKSLVVPLTWTTSGWRKGWLGFDRNGPYSLYTCDSHRSPVYLLGQEHIQYGTHLKSDPTPSLVCMLCTDHVC